MMDTVDIRDSKLKGNALKREILKQVQETQMFLIRPLPDKIRMTVSQFKELSDDPQMIIPRDVNGKILDKSTERIYLTQMNAMDVIVDDKTV